MPLNISMHLLLLLPSVYSEINRSEGKEEPPVRVLQLKEEGLTDRLAMPQLSFDPLLIWLAVMLAFPVASRETAMFWHIALGGVLSCTVTTAVQEAKLPLMSVTVRTTLFGPILMQVNEFGVTVMLAMPHASVEPLSIWDAVMAAVPEAFRLTVMFWQITVGEIVSSTVTWEMQVELFPFTSVTIRVTGVVDGGGVKL